MKCKNCGEDLFPGQYRCDKCGAFVKEETKKDKPLKKVKDKEEESWH